MGTKALKYCFKNGRLHIAGKRNVLAIEAWPAPSAMIRRSNSPWDEYAPTMRLVEPYRRKKKPAKKSAKKKSVAKTTGKKSTKKKKK